MSLIRRRLLAAGFRAYDVLVLLGAFLVAFWATYAQPVHHPIAELLGIRIRLDNFLLAGVLLWLWQGIFVAFGLYHSRRLTSRGREVRSVLEATICATLFLAGFGAVFSIEVVSWSFLALFWAATTTGMLVGRMIMREALRRFRAAGRNLRHAVLVGSNARAVAMAKRLEGETSLGYRVVGFVDDGWSASAPFARWPLLGSLQEFAGILRDHVVDEVILCLPVKSFYEEAARIAALCEEQGIQVHALSDLFDVRLRRDESEGLTRLITVNGGAMSGASLVLKRALDLVGAGMLLALSAPLFIVIAVCIRLDSPGPVLFRQTRRGLNKRPFQMLKFRSMRVDAEQMLAELEHLNQAGGPSFKLRHDPRVTRVGKLLRRTSLDELPQLINVLKGEMSLVGPRPLFSLEFDRIDAAWIKRRYSVKPGLTGLWQVCGRSELPFDRRIQLDLDYIDTWSLRLDLRILARTVPAVLLGKGAV